MMDISLKKVFNHNYASRIWLMLSIMLPILGVCVLLSFLGVLPKTPLTENMTSLIAVLFMLGCVGLMLL